VKNSDLTRFTIDILPPKHLLFKPFFFDRKREAGRGHIYYEALCHGYPHREVMMGCSARYFGAKDATSVVCPHPPVTLHIAAFIEAVRNLNSDFLDFLRLLLESLVGETGDSGSGDVDATLTQECVDSFMDGIFRNVAIQYHFGAKSHPINQMLHIDHIFSALHMAVTLNGERKVAFVETTQEGYNNVILDMQPGDVYVSCPAAIWHGIETRALNKENCSVSLQCRTWLSAEHARVFHRNNVKTFCAVVSALEKHPIAIPTYSQWLRSFNHLKLTLDIDDSEEGAKSLFSFFNDVSS